METEDKRTAEEKQIAWRKEIESYFIPESAVETDRQIHISPSGKYKLVVTPYRTKKDSWNYTRGGVLRKKDCCDDCWEPVSDIKQNYHDFRFTWVEAHPNGHDYLLCCENYQGQTTIELDTGHRVNYLPGRAMNGSGFCWIDRYPSPDNTMLAVYGCYWACPYEVIVFDFRNPMDLPYPQLARAERSVGGWDEDSKIKLQKIECADPKTGKLISEMNTEELSEYYTSIEDGDEVLVETIIAPTNLLTDRITWERVK